MLDTRHQEIEPIRNPVLSYEEFKKRREITNEAGDIVTLWPRWDNFVFSFNPGYRKMTQDFINKRALDEGVPIEDLDIRLTGKTMAFNRFEAENPDLYNTLVSASVSVGTVSKYDSIELFFEKVEIFEELLFQAYTIMKSYDDRLTDDMLFA